MDLVSRVKGILLNPKHEWSVIDTESSTISSIYTSYVIPLAAIPAVCGFIGTAIVGYNFMGVSGKLPMSTALTSAIIGFVMTLVSIYVMALIIDGLAPSFGGQKSQIQAFKVAAYSSTAIWVVGIFALLPAMGALRLLGLYSLYLLYLGLPALMKSPAEKSLGYTVVIIIAWFVLILLVGAVVAAIAGVGMMGRP